MFGKLHFLLEILPANFPKLLIVYLRMMLQAMNFSRSFPGASCNTQYIDSLEYRNLSEAGCS